MPLFLSLRFCNSFSDDDDSSDDIGVSSDDDSSDDLGVSSDDDSSDDLGVSSDDDSSDDLGVSSDDDSFNLAFSFSFLLISIARGFIFDFIFCIYALYGSIFFVLSTISLNKLIKIFILSL